MQSEQVWFFGVAEETGQASLYYFDLQPGVTGTQCRPMVGEPAPRGTKKPGGGRWPFPVTVVEVIDPSSDEWLLLQGIRALDECASQGGFLVSAVAHLAERAYLLGKNQRGADEADRYLASLMPKAGSQR